MPIKHGVNLDKVRAVARRRGTGWAIGLGALVAACGAWPAAWLAESVSVWTHGRVQLAEVEGPWWRGSALLVLSGGAGSRQATLLPSRLHWQTQWGWGEIRLLLTQSCCTAQPLVLRLSPGWQGVALALEPMAQPLQWPVDWLQGLGAPWNTFKLGGLLEVRSTGAGARLTSQGLTLHGDLTLTLQGARSPLASVPQLGSYRVKLQAQGREPVQVRLDTLNGPLLLEGQGRIGPRGLKLRAHAQAEPAQAEALKNLLNLIGPRQGARSILSIG